MMGGGELGNPVCSRAALWDVGATQISASPVETGHRSPQYRAHGLMTQFSPQTAPLVFVWVLL